MAQQLHHRTNATAATPHGEYSSRSFVDTKSTGYETMCCVECYNPRKERLEYDYQYDDTNKPVQPYPRIRERGEYYIDTYNDQPWSWTFGTNERVRGMCA